MSRIKSVIFDLDGTLADTEHLVMGCMLETINAHGHNVSKAQLLQYIGPPLPNMLFNMLGLSAEQSQPIYIDYLKRYEEIYMPQTKPLPYAEEVMDALAAASVPFALVTNKREDAGRQTVDLLGWNDRFQVIAGANTTANAKPHPDPLLYALAALEGEAASAAMVGDTESDMGAGRNAAFAEVIGIIGVRDEAYLRRHGATQVARDLREVRALLLPDS